MSPPAPAVSSAASAVLLLATAACSGSEKFVAIGTLSAREPAPASIRFLTVNNAVGSVKVIPARADEVSVRAIVSVRESMREQFPAADLARDLLVTADPDGVKVQSLHMGGAGNDGWKLDLEIEAPPRLHWTIVLAVGEVKVEADDTDVAASVAVGAIEVAGSARRVELVASTGEAKVDVARLAGGTLNAGVGSVQLMVRESGPTDALDLTTSTGGIEIALPPTAAADVTLLASMGGVEVVGAPDVKPVKGVVGQRAVGTVGAGGPKLTASAGVGGVRFRVGR